MTAEVRAMRRSSRGLGLLVAALALLATGDAWAQRGGGRGWGGSDRGFGRALKHLELSTEQVRRIGELRSAMVTKVAPLQAELRVKATELRQLWQAKRPNRQAILGKHREIDAIHAKVREARVDFRLGALGVLDAKQRGQLQTILDERRRGWGGGPGKGGRGRGKRGRGPGGGW